MADENVVIVLLARVPVAGIVDFLAYEARVLPLLAEYGGVLQRRLRMADGTVELHIVRFSDPAGLDRFRQDPRRAAAAWLLERSGATTEMFSMADVG